MYVTIFWSADYDFLTKMPVSFIVFFGEYNKKINFLAVAQYLTRLLIELQCSLTTQKKAHMLLIWGGNGQTSYICESFSLKPYRVYQNASDIQRGTYTQIIPVPSWLLY